MVYSEEQILRSLAQEVRLEYGPSHSSDFCRRSLTFQASRAAKYYAQFQKVFEQAGQHAGAAGCHLIGKKCPLDRKTCPAPVPN